MNCVSLTSIEIPSSVTSIGENAFNGCINLVTAKFPETLKEISYRSFYGCESLSNLVIKHGITTLGESAFAGATSLEEVTIPKTVTSIGDYTFNKCNLLTLGVLDASYAKDYASSNSLVYVTVKPREVVMGENNLSVTGNTITGSVLFKAVNNIEDTSIYAVFGIYQGGRLLDVQGKNVNLTWGKNDVPFTDILATSSMQGDITIKVLSWNLLSGMESVIDPFETEI